MTKQINIKLNDKKFRKILDDINSVTYNSLVTDSDIVARSMFFLHIFFFEKLDDKTRSEILKDYLGWDFDKKLSDFNLKYNRFNRNGNKSNT